MANSIFQQPLFKSSVSRDPSEMILICWFGSKETLIINQTNSFAAEYLCVNCDAFFCIPHLVESLYSHIWSI